MCLAAWSKIEAKLMERKDFKTWTSQEFPEISRVANLLIFIFEAEICVVSLCAVRLFYLTWKLQGTLFPMWSSSMESEIKIIKCLLQSTSSHVNMFKSKFLGHMLYLCKKFKQKHSCYWQSTRLVRHWDLHLLPC